MKRLPFLSFLMEVVVSLSLNMTILHSVVKVLWLTRIIILLQRMFCTLRTSYLPRRHSTSEFKVSTFVIRVVTYLLGRKISRWYPTSGSSACHAWTSSSSCTSWRTSRMLPSLRPTYISITQWSLVSTSTQLFSMLSCHDTLDKLSGTSFWRIPLHPQKVPRTTSIKEYLGGALIGSLRPRPTQIFQFRSTMTPYYNIDRWRRGGTGTHQILLTNCGLVFLTNRSSSGLTATHALGGC